MVQGPAPVTVAPVRAASMVAADASNAMGPLVVPSTVSVNLPPVALPAVTKNVWLATWVTAAGTTAGGAT